MMKRIKKWWDEGRRWHVVRFEAMGKYAIRRRHLWWYVYASRSYTARTDGTVTPDATYTRKSRWFSNCLCNTWSDADGYVQMCNKKPNKFDYGTRV